MKRLIVGVFLVAAVIGFGLHAVAQGVSSTGPMPESTKPEYTETERLMVQLVQVSDQLATCRQQLGQKGVADLSLDVRSRIEAAHPGFTVDWKTGALVAKAPPK